MQSSPSGHQDVTVLLTAVAQGDKAAADQLLPLVYEQLRKADQLDLAGERGGGAGHTLSAMALVHEAYLKLVGPPPKRCGGACSTTPDREIDGVAPRDRWVRSAASRPSQLQILTKS